MKNENPFSEREVWSLFLPKWVVEYVIAPYPDEVGWLPVILKCACIGAFLAVLAVLVLDKELLGALIVGCFWGLLCLTGAMAYWAWRKKYR